MKTPIKKLFLLPVLVAGLGLMLAGPVAAQTFTTLHNFSGYPTDGAWPYAGLLLSGNTLYGTAYGHGSQLDGTVFKVSTNGTSFTTLHDFLGYSAGDGAAPAADLILSGNTLYGTTSDGTVFKLNTNGTGYTNLYRFTAASGFPYPTNSDGAHPVAGLILSGNTLYGAAGYGGSGGAGTVFKVNTDGTGFTPLYSFSASAQDSSGFYTNSDGANPFAGLVLSGNTLYGTANVGGNFGYGTVFALNTDGTGFTTLHDFTATAGPYPATNSDGANPRGGLILSGRALFGTAAGGGSGGAGTVFKLNTDGTAFTILHTFTAYSDPFYTNSDGANPDGGLILSGNSLFGTTTTGGSSGQGTVFKVKTDGTPFTTLHSFASTSTNASGVYTNTDGTNPRGGLILSGNTLYGTARIGGSLGYGTVFSLSLPSVSAPQLTLASDGSNGYFIRAQGDPNFACRLQRAPDLSGPWDTLDTQTASASGLIEFHDTNPLPGQAFYRTVQP